MLLDPGFSLTLRPMAYPQFYEMYRAAIKNTWTVDEIDFSLDVPALTSKMSAAERHMVRRLVAFFATGDTIVANNLVLNLYQHINAPEARMYLSRQLYEEALHIQFYLTLLDTYIPDHAEREAAFDAVRNIPSIASKARFCEKWIDSIRELGRLNSREDRRRFLLNLLCFASCVEGLFFFGAFAYVYYLRSKGMLHGLADGTAWVFRDECSHMSYAFEVAKIATSEEPELMDDSLRHALGDMMREAVDCETEFAADLLSGGISGLTARDMRTYIEYCAGQRLVTMGLDPIWKVKNPFPFMELQGTQELSNFFERRVAAYQVGVTGTVELDRDF